MRSGMVLSALLAFVSATHLLAADPVDVDVRVAVIGAQTPDAEKLAPLVEVLLGQKKNIALLDRERIKEVFREQQLNALLIAEGTAKRVALGKLLKADLLVILRGEEKPQQYAEVTICETKQGLRLCNRRVEVTKNIEADAAHVLKLAEMAIEKQRRPTIDIVAVPPLVNKTLVFEGDHLRAASARLVESTLDDMPGVLSVELAEAQSISQELALHAGQGVERRLPLYLMGEYRLEPAGDQRKVSFKLVLLRGTVQVDARAVESLSLEDFPTKLQAASGEMFSKALGQNVQPADPDFEARQLADRARLAGRLGEWEDALPLAEASLLVKPDQIDLHGDTIYYMNRLVERQETLDRLRQSDMAFNPATTRLCQSLLPAYIHHVEMYMTKRHRQQWPYIHDKLPGLILRWELQRIRAAKTLEQYEQAKSEFEPVTAMARRVLASQAAVKDQQAWLRELFPYMQIPMVTSRESGWQREIGNRVLSQNRARSLTIFRDFAYLTPSDVLEYGMLPRSSGGNSREMRFLRQAAEIPFLRQTAERCIQEHRADEAKRLWYARTNKPGLHVFKRSSYNGPPATKEAKVVDPDVTYQLVPNAPVLDYCLPTIAGVDLFAGSGFYLMKEKGVFRRLHVSATSDDASKRRIKYGNVCFDGQFVWIASRGARPFVAIVDPATEETWKLTADNKLPPMDECCVSAVAPGKERLKNNFRKWL